MNFIDKIVGFVSPGAGARRVVQRFRMMEATNALRAYEAAKPSRFHKKRQDTRSPDLANENSVEALRYQARYLDENSDIARSVLNTLVDFVVGDGIRSIPQVRDKSGGLAREVNETLVRLWAEFCARPEVTWEMAWTEVQRVQCRGWFRDGECFKQLVLGDAPGLAHGSTVKLSVELIDPDLVPMYATDAARRIRQGVEKNAWGRPLGYYVLKEHPSEGKGFFFSTSSIKKFVDLTSGEVKFIPAARVTHCKMTDRVRQTRGVSIFASVYRRIDDLKEYEESERIAARIGAAFAFAITKSADAALTTTSQGTLRQLDLAPGIIFDNLAPGESVESLKNERPSNQVPDFRKVNMQAVAGGTRAGYSSVSKDYDGSYSSQRQELVEGNVGYKALRDVFIANEIIPVWNSFIDMAIAQRLINVRSIDLRTVYDAEHRGGGIPYIDPLKEVRADVESVRGGIRSLTAVTLERGGDPEQTITQIGAERRRADEEGIVLSTDPKHDKASGQASSKDDEKPDDEEETGDEENTSGANKKTA